LSRFAAVAQAMFASLAPTPADGDGHKNDAPRPDVVGALADFERWYAETHPNAFWILFETYMPETPVVDF
jgi:hypothetical protein